MIVESSANLVSRKDKPFETARSLIILDFSASRLVSSIPQLGSPVGGISLQFLSTTNSANITDYALPATFNSEAHANFVVA